MHQGAVQSSPAQQMVAAGGPSWWSINGIIPPLPQYSATPPLYHNFPYRQLSPSSLVAPPSSSWNDDQETIHQFSCSQLILGGFVGAEDNPPGLRTLENWEQQLLNLTSNSGSSSDYSAGGHGNNADQFQPTAGSWSNLMASAASSPSSCLTTLSNNLVDFSPKSSDLKHLQQDPSPECNSIGTTTTGGAAKKARIQHPSAQSTFKVRKEKLGDRITALHQLVSPFGKTDTASVLLEAIGYIRFLQSQIEALSLPYLGCSMKSGSTRQPLPAESKEDEKNKLRNRGLCLVPISCTVQMESNNGADYWAPGFGANFR